MESLTEFLSRNRPPQNGGSSRDTLDFTKLTTHSNPDDHSARERTHAHAVNQLVRGLIDLLPKADSNWRHEDRVNWLRLAADIFEVGYKSDGACAEISILAIRQVAKPKQSLNPRADNVSER
jgi:hypothetical protein